MYNVTTATAALALLTATSAYAGGVDRSGQPIAALFEPGNYFEVTLGSVSPSVSGVGSAFSPTPGGSSGDMAGHYLQFGAAVKYAVNDQIDVALIYDQPFGADVDYPAGQPYFATGSTAELDSQSLTALVKYKLPSHFSVYGGVRYQTLEAKANIPFVAGYSAHGERDGSFGYVVGAAYEIPDIALRAALTYNSEIDHSLATTENGPVPGTSSVPITTPQSVNLDFQTGIAPGTLLFAGVRWVEWTAFDITPPGYFAATGGNSLVSYDDDVFTYSLGVGRQITDALALSVSVAYEKSNGGFASNLGPTDGNMSYGVGAAYKVNDRVKISGGVRYVDIGDAQTTLGGGVAASNFRDNHAIAAGLKVGVSF